MNAQQAAKIAQQRQEEETKRGTGDAKGSKRKKIRGRSNPPVRLEKRQAPAR